MPLSRALPPLTVSGNRIVDAETSAAVRLRGVNRSGLEYSSPGTPGSLAKAGLDEADLDEMILVWGANAIRLPFNQEWALAQDAYDPEPYLSALDWLIDAAAARGAYTILDLHWLNATSPRGSNSDGSANFVPPLPNLASIELWRQLARRYRSEPAVLYDIFNEPHDALADDPEELQGIDGDGKLVSLPGRRVTAVEWHPWAGQLIRAVRDENPEALIFVSGLNWGFDLSAFPIAGIENAVYSSHVYRNKGKDWDRAFGILAGQFPVFIGEWGGRDADLSWGRELLSYMNERELSWTAWSWSDEPRLVQKGTFDPMPFGRIVRDALPAPGI